MSSARYAPLHHSHTDPRRDSELEAAFGDSEDEDEDQSLRSHFRATRSGGYHSLPNEDPISPPSVPSSPPRTPVRPTPGTYDFENVDHDYTLPPPGSPPGPSSRALPNEWGNTNGHVPSFSSTTTDAERGRGGWFRKTARTILPSHYVQRLGLAPQIPNHPIGGGTSNDGVFANVTAKPSRPLRIRDGDETILVPEESSKDAPPSYATAQADAAPSYWETTIHAPSSSSSPGEMMIDGLQTGSLFSFLWNMLVSISFQFVGFLLTYLLHTTHAAKLGSRAGLGVTLIQYGFAMRSKADDTGYGSEFNSTSGGSSSYWWKIPAPAKPSFETAAEAEQYYKHMNETLGMDALSSQDNQTNQESTGFTFNEVTSEWLSFLLMTVGWFLLLTSLLSFWRVKRWERSILSSATPVVPVPADPNPIPVPPRFPLGGVFGLRGSLFHQGLLFPASATRAIFDPPTDDEENVTSRRARSGELRGEYILPVDDEDSETTDRLTRAMVDEARLQRDLRAAGLL